MEPVLWLFYSIYIFFCFQSIRTTLACRRRFMCKFCHSELFFFKKSGGRFSRKTKNCTNFWMNHVDEKSKKNKWRKKMRSVGEKLMWGKKVRFVVIEFLVPFNLFGLYSLFLPYSICNIVKCTSRGVWTCMHAFCTLG